MGSVVAIHGKGAHPSDTWAARVNGAEDDHNPTNYCNWLNDPEMLPSKIPGARVLRCGYQSDWIGTDANYTRPSLIAESMLKDLSQHREHEPERPLVFVAHSFGGLVLLKVRQQNLRR